MIANLTRTTLVATLAAWCASGCGSEPGHEAGDVADAADDGGANDSGGGVPASDVADDTGNADSGPDVVEDAAGDPDSTDDTGRVDVTDTADIDADAADGATDRCDLDVLDAVVVVATSVSPLPSAPEDTVIEGVVTYHGPVREPIATHPAIDHEIAIANADGTESILQYFLPRGIEIPVSVGGSYAFTWRQRQGFEGSANGLVVTRPTSGLPPLLFVVDLGTYWRAFDDDDPAIAPLTVHEEPDPACGRRDDLDPCCDLTLQERLRFESTAGSVTVAQGSSAEVPLFGQAYVAYNLQSTMCEEFACTDTPASRVAFVITIGPE